MNPLRHPSIARFKPDAIVSQGERATVWSGHCSERRCAVAIKLLGNQRQTSPTGHGARFLQWAGTIRDQGFTVLPNVLSAEVLEDGTGLLVAEWVDGLGLEDWRLPALQTAESLLELVEGLDRLAVQGTAHLNVCPENLIIGLDGRLRLLGLGTPFFQERLLGPFSAPELPTTLAAGGALWRADLYSVALLTCELLGLTVEGAGTPLPYVQLGDAEAKPLRGIEGLRLLLESALHQLPSRRPASFGILARALRNSIERTTGSIGLEPSDGSSGGRVMVFGPTRPSDSEAPAPRSEADSEEAQTDPPTIFVGSDEVAEPSIEATDQAASTPGPAETIPDSAARELGATDSPQEVAPKRLSRLEATQLAREASNRLEELLFPAPTRSAPEELETPPDEPDSSIDSTIEASVPAESAEPELSETLRSQSVEEATADPEEGKLWIAWEDAVASFDVDPSVGPPQVDETPAVDSQLEQQAVDLGVGAAQPGAEGSVAADKALDDVVGGELETDERESELEAAATATSRQREEATESLGLRPFPADEPETAGAAARNGAVGPLGGDESIELDLGGWLESDSEAGQVAAVDAAPPAEDAEPEAARTGAEVVQPLSADVASDVVAQAWGDQGSGAEATHSGAGEVPATDLFETADSAQERLAEGEPPPLFALEDEGANAEDAPYEVPRLALTESGTPEATEALEASELSEPSGEVDSGALQSDDSPIQAPQSGLHAAERDSVQVVSEVGFDSAGDVPREVAERPVSDLPAAAALLGGASGDEEATGSDLELDRQGERLARSAESDEPQQPVSTAEDEESLDVAPEAAAQRPTLIEILASDDLTDISAELPPEVEMMLPGQRKRDPSALDTSAPMHRVAEDAEIEQTAPDGAALESRESDSRREHDEVSADVEPAAQAAVGDEQSTPDRPQLASEDVESPAVEMESGESQVEEESGVTPSEAELPEATTPSTPARPSLPADGDSPPTQELPAQEVAAWAASQAAESPAELADSIVAAANQPSFDEAGTVAAEVLPGVAEEPGHWVGEEGSKPRRASRWAAAAAVLLLLGASALGWLWWSGRLAPDGPGLPDGGGEQIAERVAAPAATPSLGPADEPAVSGTVDLPDTAADLPDTAASFDPNEAVQGSSGSASGAEAEVRREAEEAARSVPLTDPSAWNLTEDDPAPAARREPLPAEEREVESPRQSSPSIARPVREASPTSPESVASPAASPPRPGGAAAPASELGDPARSASRAALAAVDRVQTAFASEGIREIQAALRDSRQAVVVAGSEPELAAQLLELERAGAIAESWGLDRRRPLDGPLDRLLDEARILSGVAPQFAERAGVTQRLETKVERLFADAMARGQLAEAGDVLESVKGVGWLGTVNQRLGAELEEALALRARSRLEQRIAGALRRGQPHEVLDEIDALPAARTAGLEDSIRVLRERMAALDVAAPTLSIDSLSDLEFQAGQDLTLRLRGEDDYEVVEVQLFVRPVGGAERDYTPVTVRFLGGRVFGAEVPRSLHLDRPLQIYGVARDRSGNEGYLASARAPVRIKPRG